MALSIDSALRKLAHAVTGKNPGVRSIEGIVQFMADNYQGGGVANDAVGIKSVSGSIDSSNKLTLIFKMTDGSTNRVVGTITTSDK